MLQKTHSFIQHETCINSSQHFGVFRCIAHITMKKILISSLIAEGVLDREVVVWSGSPGGRMAGADLNQRAPAMSLTPDHSNRPQVCFQYWEPEEAVTTCVHCDQQHSTWTDALFTLFRLATDQLSLGPPNCIKETIHTLPSNPSLETELVAGASSTCSHSWS
ncbi:UNVERIFIED_CONTAM: hypothetical protein K2H54_055436 [Gekko kuhli]